MPTRTLSVRSSYVALVLLLAGCSASQGSGGAHESSPDTHDAAASDGSSSEPTADASAGADGTIEAGGQADASVEASTGVDSSADATTAPTVDAGPATDASPATDAATDGGIEPEAAADAGPALDAPTDTGTALADGATDASTAPDAPTEAGGEAGTTSSDSGSTSPMDAGITSTDPFDPASCPGTPLTTTQAAQLFQSGSSQAIVGSYTIEMRQRSCTAVTGCGAWGTPTTTIAATLGDGIDRSLSGQILLTVQSTSILLSLQDSTEVAPYTMGTQCSAIDGSTETCGSYSYNLGDQWGGSGGLFPTLEPLIDQNGANVTFSGVLTSQCLRLSYAALDTNSNEVQQFVVLAPVSSGAPPAPNPCPGGGTQMACGSQASQATTCCQAGLTTCPSSGCDCWSACN